MMISKVCPGQSSQAKDHLGIGEKNYYDSNVFRPRTQHNDPGQNRSIKKCSFSDGFLKINNLLSKAFKVGFSEVD